MTNMYADILSGYLLNVNVSFESRLIREADKKRPAQGHGYEKSQLGWTVVYVRQLPTTEIPFSSEQMGFNLKCLRQLFLQERC